MKQIFWLLLLVISCGKVSAQGTATPSTNMPTNSSFGDRIVTGGNFGLQFGNITYIDISPLVGYKVTEHFVPGIGVTYRYLNYHRYNYVQNAYGGSLFARYYIFENLFAHAQYEILNGEWDPYRPDYRFNIGSFFVGGGYRQSWGGKFGTSVLVLFNLSESVYSPYQNPIIRVGFGFGL